MATHLPMPQYMVVTLGQINYLDLAINSFEHLAQQGEPTAVLKSQLELTLYLELLKSSKLDAKRWYYSFWR